MRRSLLILAVPLLIGCTAESHRRSADAQVNRLLRERQRETLDYAPQVEVSAHVPERPGRREHDRIPFTAVAPRQPEPIEPSTQTLPHGRLGPPVQVIEDAPAFGLSRFGVEAAEREAAERLRLGPAAPSELPLQLDLLGSIDYAVRHSRSYRNQMEELYLTALNVTLERHLFSPRPFAQTGVELRGGGRDVDYQTAMAVTGSAGVRQRLPYGGEIVARTLVEFVNAVHGEAAEGESASVVLSGSVPLMRGAGMVNLESLIRSERRLVYQVRSFEDFRRQFAVNISTQYFNLLTLQQRLNNRRLNYQSLLALLERSEALFDAGRISFLEVQRSAQALLVAQDALIAAQDAYQTALDNFKIVLGMPVDQELHVVAVEMQVKIPELTVDEVIELAMRYRLDLQTARDQIDDARRGVANARQGLGADLTLAGQARVRNTPGTDATNLNLDTLSYSAGVTLDLPIDRLPERNVYRRSLIDYDRARRSYEELQQRIAVAARDALRAIESAQMSLEIQRRSIDLAERRLENANELFATGRTDARNVEEAQTSLLNAQDAFDRARAQLQIQVLQYLRETGTLRIDPEAGLLGQAMDRARIGLNIEVNGR